MGLVLCVSTVNCDYLLNGNDGKNSPVPLPLPCTDACKTDLEQTPEAISYFNGGWYGPFPNYKIKMDLKRVGQKVTAKIEVPTCTVEGDVKPVDYVALDKLATDVTTYISGVQMIDGGDEVLTFADGDTEEKLYLKVSDSSYQKPIVKNASDVEAIRNQLQVIADSVLVHCAKTDATYKIWLREHVSASAVVDADMLVPHPRFTINIQDIRVSHETTGIRIDGFRRVVKMNETCQWSINKHISNDTAWRLAMAKVSIERSEVICDMAQGSSPDDIRVIFPKYPKVLSMYKKSGKVESTQFGCNARERVANADDFERLVNQYLTAQSPVCTSNISEPYDR